MFVCLLLICFPPEFFISFSLVHCPLLFPLPQKPKALTAGPSFGPRDDLSAPRNEGGICESKLTPGEMGNRSICYPNINWLHDQCNPKSNPKSVESSPSNGY